MNSTIQNHLHFIDQHKICYPAGYHVVEYNLQEKSQAYYTGQDGYRSYSAISLSQQRR